jgi:hypothetical protein
MPFIQTKIAQYFATSINIDGTDIGIEGVRVSVFLECEI